MYISLTNCLSQFQQHSYKTNNRNLLHTNSTNSKYLKNFLNYKMYSNLCTIVLTNHLIDVFVKNKKSVSSINNLYMGSLWRFLQVNSFLCTYFEEQKNIQIIALRCFSQIKRMSNYFLKFIYKLNLLKNVVATF